MRRKPGVETPGFRSSLAIRDYRWKQIYELRVGGAKF